MPRLRITFCVPRTCAAIASSSSRPQPPTSGVMPGTPASAAAPHVVPPDRRALALGADDIRQAVGDRHRPGGGVDRRRVVDRERLERLDQVAAVHVDQRIGRLDQLGEDVVGELVRERPGRVAGEAAVQVLVVGRGDERRPRPKRRQVHDRDGHHRPARAALDRGRAPLAPPRRSTSTRIRGCRPGCTAAARSSGAWSTSKHGHSRSRRAGESNRSMCRDGPAAAGLTRPARG